MREIVLDTETTGLRFREDGDRIIEIGCVELINHVPSGATFQHYIDPERDVPAEAVAIHGITNEKLAGKPVFADIADEFLAFVAGDPLIIHNAGFDVPFLNFELERAGKPPLSFERIIDTLLIAVPALRHRQFPAHLSRRAARFRNPGGGLSGADRRSAGRHESGHRCRGRW